MALIEIRNEKLTVGIDTLGAELQYLNRFDGKEYLWNGNPEVWKYRAPILFPFCGDLNEGRYTFEGKEYKLPRHGFARDKEFAFVKDESLIDSEDRSGSKKAVFVLESDEETHKMYPFDFRLKVIYELEDFALAVKYEVENLSEGDMYFSIGSHEGYRIRGKIEHNSVYTDEIIPLLYDYFEGESDTITDIDPEYTSATLKMVAKDDYLTVSFGKVESFSIWTKRDAEFICLEPWHGIPEEKDADADITKKRGIQKLAAGESEVYIHTIEIHE
ncbi:MAG: hypothetical protein E7225_05440 [Clostridiales bacterium]|nr:hypothetical protein [Clostridiales bacterium]